VVTGSSMGAGPLPQLLNAGVRLSPDDVRVMGARGASAAREVGDIPRDFSAAQSGLTRLNAYDQPTYGARIQGVAEDIGDVMARRQGMRSEEGAPSMSGFGTFTDMVPDPRMYAVKPKGGNWPTNLGSTKPLSEQGSLGDYLAKSQFDDPVAVFEQQLLKHFDRGMDNRQLFHDWQDYLGGYISMHANGVKYADPDGAPMQALKKEAADKFAEAYNAGSIGSADIEPTDKKLNTASQIAQVLPAYNSWVMGPFQKYITNQMGTGLATDPLLQAVNESGMPPNEIFGQEVPRDYEIESLEKNAAGRRKAFLDAMFGYSDSPEKQAALQDTSLGKITATTPEGIAYENALDASLYPKGPYSFKDDGGGTTEFPAVSKLERNALISDFLTSPEKQTGFHPIRKQVFQDLLSGKLDPGKLSNVTPATVTRQMIKDKMAEFKEQQLSKKGAADWIPKRAAEMPTDMEFPDGSKMTIITPEMAKADENMTARDLGQITIDLNQCVGAGCHATQDYPGHGPFLVPHTGKPPRGKVEPDKYGYLRRLKNDEIEIASLKDPEGVSKATIELKLEKPKRISSSQKEAAVGFWLEDNKTPEDVAEFYANKAKHGIDLATYWAVEKFPELQARLDSYNGTPKKSVTQIKGRSNNEINKEYVPHVVQWLNTNADQLTDVRDLDNLPNVHDLTRSYDAVGRLMEKNQHWYSPTVEAFFETMENENALPRFFTTDEFALKATERGVDLSAEPKNDVVNDGVLTDQEKEKRQKYYETVSQELRNTFTDVYLQDAFNRRDNPALRQIVQELEERPTTYFLGSPSPGTRQAVINRLRNQGLFNPEEENLANAIQQMEPEAEQQLPFNRPEFPDALAQNMRDYMEGNAHNLPEDMIEPYATDMRILMGSQREEARLPRFATQALSEMLLDQDTHTQQIRELINQLQATGNEGMVDISEPQAENMLNMLISWTERYPLNE
jgi:hypothetical protein